MRELRIDIELKRFTEADIATLRRVIREFYTAGHPKGHSREEREYSVVLPEKRTGRG